MSKKRKFSEEEVIQKATELFWEKGYTSTSLIDLTNHLKIGEGSFYNTFKSKKNLYVLCYNQYMSMRFEQFKSVFESIDKPRKAFQILFEFLLNEFLQDNKHRGCFFANTCSELANQDPVILKLIESHHKQTFEIFSDYLSDKEWNSSIPKSIYIHLISTYVLGLKHQSKFDFNKEHYLKPFEELIKLLD